MEYNFLDFLAEEIAGIFIVFKVVIIRMIKDRRTPYVLILFDDSKTVISYDIVSENIENVDFDFEKKQELLILLSEKKELLLELWQKLNNNENINGINCVFSKN